MATIVAPPYNTGSTSVTSGSGYPGDAATGFGQRQFVSYMEALEPYITPFQSGLARGGVQTQLKMEWNVKAQLPYSFPLNGAMTNSQTTMTLDSPNGSALQKGMVIYIPVDASGNAAEVVWIDDTNGTLAATGVTAGLVRGQGGTSGVAHDDNTTVYVIGVALPENNDFTLAAYEFGDLYYNYPQRFQKKVSVDLRQDVTPNIEDPDANIFESRLQTTAKDVKLNFELALLYGRRQAETYGATKKPSLLSGLDHFCELAGNDTDANSALLSPYLIETAVKDRWDVIGDQDYTFLANMNTKMCFDRAFNVKREATMSDTTANLTVERVNLSTGPVSIQTSRHLNGIGDGTIWFYRKKDLKLHPYKGLDWHFRRKVAGVDTDGDYVAGSISGDFSFSAAAPKAMGRIINIESDVTLYPDLQN